MGEKKLLKNLSRDGHKITSRFFSFQQYVIALLKLNLNYSNKLVSTLVKLQLNS